MKDKVRVGIIGSGFGRQVLLPAFRADARCEIVAVCSKSLEKANSMASENNIARFSDLWSELVDSPVIDALVIATTPAVQVEIARAAISAGKHVFCEKPLSVTVAESESLLELARKYNVANVVDFEFCETSAFQKARETLLRGEIGDLVFVNVSWTELTYENKAGLSTWKSDWAQGGTVLNLFGSHVFRYLEWFLGPIGQLSARLTSRKNLIGEATAQIHCITESGVPVTVSICTEAANGAGHEIEFFGNKGSLFVRNSTKDYVSGFEVILTTNAGSQTLIGQSDKSHGVDGRISAVANLGSRFITWVLEGVPSSSDFVDGLRVQQLLRAARESSDTGKSIECAPLQCVSTS